MRPLNNEDYGLSNIRDLGRIGKAKITLPDSTLDKMKEFEEVMLENCHLPIQFDTRKHYSPEKYSSYYPINMSYTYFSHFIMVNTNETEFNIRLIEKELQSLHWKKSLIKYKDIFPSNFSSKYEMLDIDPDIEFSEVFFAPGHNWKFTIDYEKLSEKMDLNPDMVIKPHPLTDDHTIEEYGIDFGFERVIEKNASGDQVLDRCKKAYYVYSSEYGFKSILKGIPSDHMNKYFLISPLSYSAIYFNARKYKLKDQKKVVGHILTNPNCGIFDMNKSIEELEEDFIGFLNNLEELRNYFKPRRPYFSHKVFRDYKLQMQKKEETDGR